jgi:tRNA pseudouridine55 synthase
LPIPGLLLIDKESNWTSHDVVAKVRGLAGTRKVGHAGTLDPMATGLLLIGVESATKLLTFLVGESKTYTATIRLGASTITDDREGDFLTQAEPGKVLAISKPQLEAALDALRGEIMQVPSSVSAIKVDGQRAYAKVRGGDAVKLAARPVNISRFSIDAEPRLVDEQYLDLDVTVECSSGTYIRALARDLGEALGVGGHLTALRRTHIGRYSVEQAKTIGEFQKIKQDGKDLPILASAQAAEQQFVTRVLKPQEVIDIRHGKRIPADSAPKEVAIAALDQAGNLIAMLERSGGQLKSSVVFSEGANA